MMFVVEDFFQINQPFTLHTHDADGCRISTKTVRKRINRYRIIDRPDVDGKNTGFPVLLPGIPVHPVKSLLPFTDQQKIYRIAQQIKTGFFIVTIQRCPDKLPSSVLCILRFIKCFACITGKKEEKKTENKNGFQWNNLYKIGILPFHRSSTFASLRWTSQSTLPAGR